MSSEDKMLYRITFSLNPPLDLRLTWGQDETPFVGAGVRFVNCTRGHGPSSVVGTSNRIEE